MAEQRNIHTRGIILKKHAFGENDFSVTIYSPELGKIQATAKGARKIKSSLAGHIETLNLCEFQLYKSPARYTMVQCHVLENFKSIRADFDKAMIAGLMVEIFHKSTLTSEHSQELFYLLQQSLLKLSSSEQHFLTVESFKLNLLQHIGALPDLESCASCNQRLCNETKVWLEPNGHLQCHNCLYPEIAVQQFFTPDKNFTNPDYDPKNKLIEFNIIKLIHYLIQPFTRTNQKLTVTPQQKEQLQYITRFFLQHFLDREIISEKMLMQLM